MRLGAILIIFGLVFIGGVFLAGCRKQQKPSTTPSTPILFLMINGKNYSIEIAKTPEEHQLGLSNRNELGKDGMLFVFSEPKIPAFWMKDMRFNLDFIWIKDNTVVEITKNVKKPESPNENLPIYRPKQLVDMMLEVNAGFVDKESIKVGDQVQLVR